MTYKRKIQHRSRPAGLDSTPAEPVPTDRSPEPQPASSDDDEVGYGNPPKRTRWRKGTSGNPKGRPPQARNCKTVVEKELSSKISVREGGTVVKLTKREALIKRLVEKGLKGDLKAIATLMTVDDELAAAAEKLDQNKGPQQVSQDDHAILKEVFKMGAEAVAAGADR